MAISNLLAASCRQFSNKAWPRLIKSENGGVQAASECKVATHFTVMGRQLRRYSGVRNTLYPMGAMPGTMAHNVTARKMQQWGT